MDHAGMHLLARGINQTELAISKNFTCPVEGNPDLYGLGIRIGIYIQMWTVQLSSLASAYLPIEDTLGEGTIIFVLSTLIVLVRQLVKLDIQPVEAYPVIMMLMMQITVCRNSYRSVTIMIIGVAVFCGMTALSTWFWWHGMDTLPRRCDDDKAFFFAKVSIWHWFRTFNKVMSILSAISGSLVAITFIVGYTLWGVTTLVGLSRGERPRRLSPGAQLEARAEARAAQSQNNNNNNSGVGGLDLALNIGIVVYVEMALKWNKVSGVHTLNSPGQFMPFFIALAQFMTVFYGVARTMLRLNADEDQFYEEEDDLECPHGRGHYTPSRQADIPLATI